jgi:hypothetical protein
MKASVVDFHDDTLDILQALDNNESITVIYRGEVKGVIKPAKEGTKKQIKEHPFFGMYRDNTEGVLDQMSNLRKPRYDI